MHYALSTGLRSVRLLYVEKVLLPAIPRRFGARTFVFIGGDIPRAAML